MIINVSFISVAWRFWWRHHLRFLYTLEQLTVGLLEVLGALTSTATLHVIQSDGHSLDCNTTLALINRAAALIKSLIMCYFRCCTVNTTSWGGPWAWRWFLVVMILQERALWLFFVLAWSVIRLSRRVRFALWSARQHVLLGLRGRLIIDGRQSRKANVCCCVACKSRHSSSRCSVPCLLTIQCRSCPCLVFTGLFLEVQRC